VEQLPKKQIKRKGASPAKKKSCTIFLSQENVREKDNANEREKKAYAVRIDWRVLKKKRFRRVTNTVDQGIKRTVALACTVSKSTEGTCGYTQSEP